MIGPTSPWSTGFTAASVPPAPFQVGPADSFFLLGSCFSDHLADHLDRSFLTYQANPFGQLYSPSVLAQALDLLAGAQELEEAALFCHRDLWRHPLFHTDHSRLERDELVAHLHGQIERGRAGLASAGVLVLTLGTAWVFEHRVSGRVWANCHTLPGSEFHRRLETPAEAASLITSLERVQRLFPYLRVVVTLSPVRHLRDGAVQNSLGKAHLRLVAEALVTAADWAERRFYFPASEILLDELRDYRWYAEDLVHPSAQAGAAIAQRFLQTVANPRLAAWLPEAARFYELVNHRLRHPTTPDSLAFQTQRRQRLAELIEQWPELIPLSAWQAKLENPTA